MSTDTPAQPAEPQAAPPVALTEKEAAEALHSDPGSVVADVHETKGKRRFYVWHKVEDAEVKKAKEQARWRQRASRKKTKLLATEEEFAWVTVESKAAVVVGLRRMNEIINNPESGLDQVSKALMTVRQFLGVRALKNAELPEEGQPKVAEAPSGFAHKLEGLTSAIRKQA